MRWRGKVQRVLRRRGYELVRFPIMRFLRQFDINVVLDIGANDGGYAREIRTLGYDKKIVSFEPLSTAFRDLEQNAKPDPNWTPVHLALGSKSSQATLHVSGDSASSSLLDMVPKNWNAGPDFGYVGSETVSIEPLDAVFDRYCGPGDRVYLKIDTQGFEDEVLRGAEAMLPKITGLQMELSLVPIYEGQMLAEDLISYVRARDFTPFWINHGFKDVATQQLLQLDAMFFRT